MNTQFISWHIHPAPQYVDPLKEGPRLLACQPVEKLLHASLRALIEDSAPQFCSVLAVFTRVWMLFGLSASRRATFATGCCVLTRRGFAMDFISIRHAQKDQRVNREALAALADPVTVKIR